MPSSTHRLGGGGRTCGGAWQMGRAGLLEVHPQQSWVSTQPLLCTLDPELLASFPAHSDNIPHGERPVGGRAVALWGAGLELLIKV